MRPAFALTDRQRLQRDLMAGPATHILGYGGGRSGKTVGFMRGIALRALKGAGSRHLCARRHNNTARRTLLQITFQEVMTGFFPGVAVEVNKADQIAYLPGGSEMLPLLIGPKADTAPDTVVPMDPDAPDGTTPDDADVVEAEDLGNPSSRTG